jgi:pyruvate dehydrogenase E2 component (dihydrolipoamide acetyltransferase)
MITEVILPKLGQTMDEGAIVEWAKQVGDPVNRGDVLFTVESDKAVLEVEATARGFLRKILVPAGQSVPVLTVVALITRDADKDISGYQATGERGTTEPEMSVLEPPPEPATSGLARATERIFASPRARKTARERGVNLAQVPGTGPSGRIVEQDVLHYVASPPSATPVAVKVAEAQGIDLVAVRGTGPGGRITKADILSAADVAEASSPSIIPSVAPPAAPPSVEALATQSAPLTGLRSIIAERMAASDAQTARVTLVTEADATSFVEARESLKATVTEEWGFAPSYNDLLGLVVARALREFSYMNARLSDDGNAIERLPFINLGMAVETERGLLVPVVGGADQM